MRITNKIMQNNALSNINLNKQLEDKLQTQMTTQRKINRPSDDPIVAIRALRLRSNLSQITQYYEKNVPDARAWLDVTSTSLDMVAKLLGEMRDNCQTGINDSWTPDERAMVLESMKKFAEELYSTGDVDFGGRNVFTGYRTGTKLTFQSDTNQTFTINEQLDRDCIDKVTFVKTYNDTGTGVDSLEDLNDLNYNSMSTSELTVEAVEVYRMRLAYENLDSPANISIGYDFIKDANGILQPQQTLTVTSEVNSYDIPDPYTTLGPDDVVLVRDTGELLLGANAYAKLAGMKDNPNTPDVNEGEIRITYDKSEWKKGDLNPVHYFACTSTPPGETSPVNYNPEYLNNLYERQEIEYDVGFNQSIKVNTTADEVYTHDIGRDVQELIRALEDVIEMEGIVEKMESLMKADPLDDAAKLQYEAANKALTLMQDKLHQLFSTGLTKFDAYLKRTNQADANNGTRGSRLELIENRLQSQQTTFDELADDNEGADLTKVAIELESARTVYNAALMATAGIIQNTLLNYL